MSRSGVCLLLIGLFGCACAAPNGDCDAKKLDACAAELFVFATSEKIPTTAAELKPFCAKQQKSLECSRDYLKRCTESVVQGIGSIFLDDISAEIEGRCDESSDYHKAYLKHSPCMNKAGASIHKCIRSVAADLDVASRLPAKQRIGGACCKYNVLESCVKKAIEGKCDAEAHKFAEGLLEKYAGELLGTVCTAYRSGDKCKSIPFDSAPGDKSIRSVLTPLIKIGSALG
ncbi:hypothetical protein V5799_014417 [Amblyomma americanum]|uniref:Secreted protein n=1 Tax=Amblyomma americanum TaxID=6943 RepID=A0AAQ4E333_AMBAM